MRLKGSLPAAAATKVDCVGSPTALAGSGAYAGFAGWCAGQNDTDNVHVIDLYVLE